MQKFVQKSRFFIVALFLVGLFFSTLHETQPLHDSSECALCVLTQLDDSSDLVVPSTLSISTTHYKLDYTLSLFCIKKSFHYNSRAPPTFS